MELGRWHFSSTGHTVAMFSSSSTSSLAFFWSLLLLLLLLLPFSSASLAPPATLTARGDVDVDGTPGALLSRHRRFVVASSTGWILTASFGVSAPNQDGGTIALSVPFRYFLDTQVWFARWVGEETAQPSAEMMIGGPAITNFLTTQPILVSLEPHQRLRH